MAGVKKATADSMSKHRADGSHGGLANANVVKRWQAALSEIPQFSYVAQAVFGLLSVH